MAKPAFDAMRRMKWTVLTRDHGEMFITSDNPLCYAVDPRTLHPIYGGHGFANKTVKVTFPLSPSQMLLMTWNHEMPNRLACPTEEVKTLNRLRTVDAEELVFSPENKQGLNNLVAKHADSKRRIEFGGAGPEKPAPIQVVRKYSST